MQISVLLARATLLLIAASVPFSAQAPAPAAQPTYITIHRESVRTGHGAAHEKHEAGWVAAFEKAKWPSTYLALASMTGTPEVWFVEPFESFAARGRLMEAEGTNAPLTAELQRQSEMDAQHLDGTRTLEAMAVPELSHGTFPSIGKQRFYEITIFRVRPGFEGLFAETATMYKAL